MISDQTLNHLVERLDKINELASQYGLDKISLLQPRYNEKSSKLHFVLSRKDNLLLVNEVSRFNDSLYDLLEVDGYSDNAEVEIKVREAFIEKYFTDIYEEKIFSIFPVRQNLREDLIKFIKEDLGFNGYEPAVAAVLHSKEESSEQKEAAIPRLNPNKRAADNQGESDQQQGAPKRLKNSIFLSAAEEDTRIQNAMEYVKEWIKGHRDSRVAQSFCRDIIDLSIETTPVIRP